MRPLILELEGFGAFRSHTVIDFAEADFFALVGPTGSGKSTVIDALCYALYGVVPRLDDKRVTDALSVGAVEMKVGLTFEVAGISYLARRVVRRSPRGKVGTAEARLERLDSGLVLAGRESEFASAIESLLGLTVDDFTRCVVLPQGDFARFLHDKPADRQALLVRLMELGVYGRVRARAHEQAAELDLQIRELDGRLNELGLCTEADLLAEQQRAGLLRVLEVSADEVVSWMQTQQEAMAELEQQRDAAVAALLPLRTVLVPPELSDHSSEMRRIDSALIEAIEAAGCATADVDAAERRLADAGDREQIRDGLRTHAELHRLSVEAAELRSEADRLVGAAAAIELERADAEQMHKQALTELDALRLQHRAYHVAIELVPGEPCPACEQLVHRLPLPTAPPALRAIDDAEKRTREREQKVSERSARAARQADLAVGRADDLERRVERLRSTCADLLPEADLRAADQRINLLEAQLRSAREADAARRRAERAARDVVEQARARQMRVAAAYTGQRDPLVARGAPAPVGDDLVASWTALAHWAAAETERAEADVRATERSLAERRVAGEARVAALIESMRSGNVAVGRSLDPQALRNAITAERARSDERVRRAADARVRRDEFERIRLETVSQRHVAADLARLLKADHFQQWLVEETLAALAHRAAATLRRLSAGQFSLRLGRGGEFEVIDHTAADEARPVRTLSGGETFQASLALALALSDHLVEVSGRAASALDSIFLDEGFGTLDSESLDLVASTIEALGAEGRMVGVVTHVRELADRVPVRFRVSKDAQSARVVRESAS